MGQLDLVAKKYMRDPERFADAFNAGLFCGKQVIDPEKLRELDPAEILIPDAESKAGDKTVGKMRDLLKCATVMTDEEKAYLLLGIENQADVNYAMPVRAMVYDAIRYVRQVDDIRKQNRRRGGLPGANYVSGFQKTDRLMPVITLVMYYKPDRWDGARSLHEMFGPFDREILDKIADYKLNIIEPSEITEEELKYYTTELGNVITYVKHSADKEDLKQVIHEDDSFKEVDIETARFIKVISGKKIKFNPKGGVVNMCKAMDDWEAEAIAIGEAKGEAKGEARGIAKGEATGDDRRRKSMAKKLYAQGVSISIIANAAEATDETVREWLGLQPA